MVKNGAQGALKKRRNNKDYKCISGRRRRRGLLDGSKLYGNTVVDGSNAGCFFMADRLKCVSTGQFINLKDLHDLNPSSINHPPLLLANT